MSLSEKDVEEIQTHIADLQAAGKHVWIDSSEDGWLIGFTGDLNGVMHPRTFLDLMRGDI